MPKYDVQKMLELYEEFGTYSAVAKKMGCAASTVSKYISAARANKTCGLPEYSGGVPKLPSQDIVNFYNYGKIYDVELQEVRRMLLNA